MKLVFPGWDRFQASLGKGEGHWVKLWREERGSFAQLPLIARGLFSEMLKLADETGTIQLGNKEPWDATAFALGADRADRRALKKYIPMLIEDGCMKLRSDADSTMTEPRLDHDGATTEPPLSHEATTTEPRSDHDRTTKRPRPNHEGEAKCAESLVAHSLLLKYKEEEKEEEKENTAREGPSDSEASRWMHLDESWRKRFGSGLGGLFDAKRASTIRKLRVSLPTRDDWDSEVFSFVEFIASSEWRPGSVWAYFASNAGDFRQKHAAASRKRKTQNVHVPDASEFAEANKDLDDVFSTLEVVSA